MKLFEYQEITGISLVTAAVRALGRFQKQKNKVFSSQIF